MANSREIKSMIKNGAVSLPEFFSYLSMADALCLRDFSLWSGYSEKQLSKWIKSGKLKVCEGKITKTAWNEFKEGNTFTYTLSRAIKIEEDFIKANSN